MKAEFYHCVQRNGVWMWKTFRNGLFIYRRVYATMQEEMLRRAKNSAESAEEYQAEVPV